jgi:hypothetical protein
MPSLPPATQVLLLANVAVFFLERLIGGAVRAARPLADRSGNSFPGSSLIRSCTAASSTSSSTCCLWMFGSELEHVGQKRYVQFLLGERRRRR